MHGRLISTWGSEPTAHRCRRQLLDSGTEAQATLRKEVEAQLAAAKAKIAAMTNLMEQIRGSPSTH